MLGLVEMDHCGAAANSSYPDVLGAVKVGSNVACGNDHRHIGKRFIVSVAGFVEVSFHHDSFIVGRCSVWSVRRKALELNARE